MTSNAQAKLDYIAGTKTAIGNAIEAKGVTLGASTFREYADRVVEIPSPTDYVLREYTGSATWTKPTGLKEIFVVCIGGGAGGGSGSRGAAGVLRRGGGGGGGTVIVWRKISAAELGATETVIIGGGGSGGAAVTADSTDGNDGTAGGDTSFGTLVVSKGGNLGKKGINASALNIASDYTAVTDSIPSFSFFQYAIGYGTNSSGTGGNGSYSNPFVLYNLGDPSVIGGGGAGGGGKSTGDGTGIGGNGSRLYKIDNTQSAAVTGGAANTAGGNGLDNQGLQLLMQYNTTAIPTKGLGTSGAGGGAGDNTPTAAGAGGNGGLYGGSGGGGGASLNGANSGKGGDGAGGLCLVYEQY